MDEVAEITSEVADDATPLQPAAPPDITVLYLEHHDRLVMVALAVVHDRALAEDIVQDAFVSIQRFRGPIEHPVAYLQRSVINLAISKVRRRRMAARRIPPPTRPGDPPEFDETWNAVMGLPARQRAVIVLRFYEDLPIDEIAERLGWPAGTVKSALHRALVRLKEELRP